MLLLDSEPEAMKAPRRGVPLTGSVEMPCCCARRRNLGKIAPEFHAVGNAISAFLTGSVKGSGLPTKNDWPNVFRQSQAHNTTGGQNEKYSRQYHSANTSL